MLNASSVTDIVLDSNLNLMAAATLAQILTDQLNTSIVLNAENVIHIDLPCLQVLISAARHWRSEGMIFEIENMSEAFAGNLTTLGLNPSIFQTTEPS